MLGKGTSAALGLADEYRARASAGEAMLLVIDHELQRQAVVGLDLASRLSGVPVAVIVIALEEHGLFGEGRFTIVDYA